MGKRIAIGFVIILIAAAIVGAVAMGKMAQFKALGSAGGMQMPPDTVTSVVASEAVWPQTIPAVGTVVAVQGVTVSTELSGVVKELSFESGQEVAAGEVLLKLDATTEEAQLRAAEARAELARLDLERSKELLGNRVISQAEQDSKNAQFKQSVAEVENLKATVEKKTVRAPFGGQLGIRSVDLGEFLNVGAPVVSLQSMDPVYIDFTVPQQQLSQIREGLEIAAKTDAYEGQSFAGKVSAIDTDVDVNTRSVKIRATVPNPDKLLRPGMYVTVDVVLPTQNPVLALPGTAIVYAPYGDSVYIIEESKDEAGNPVKKLRQQFVSLGEARGDFVAVVSGLNQGEKVVSAGVFKLRNGSNVVEDNTLRPEAQLNPKPTEG